MEWLAMITIVTPTIRGKKGLRRVKEGLDQQTYDDFEWLVEEHDPNSPPDFNKAMNRMLKKAKGELIVFVQDYIKIPKNGLKTLWMSYQLEPNVCFTCPVGQQLRKRIKWDWRVHRTDNCNFMEWEIDYGSAPLAILKEIGGFDEELDKCWGYDNVNVGLRIELAGYKIKCLKNNRSVALPHDKFIKHPYRKLMNADFHNERLDEFRHGLTLNYI